MGVYDQTERRILYGNARARRVIGGKRRWVSSIKVFKRFERGPLTVR